MAHPIILTLLAFTLCLTIAHSTLVIKKERFSAPRDAVGAIQVADQFYFAGGFELNDYIPTNIVEIYNITSGEWEEPIFLEEPRGFISTAVIGQNIYFVAGSQFPNSCTMLYNSSLHQYEDIGCGPTVRTPIQVSNHNSTVTVLGAFSADFFNSSKQWEYIPTLTSWMQRISGGIKLVYENLIVGIGGVNSTTLQPLYAAWIYDTYTHNLTVFNSVVTTASTFSSNFGFTVAHGRLVAYSSDRYFVHQFGTEEWHEVLLDSPTQAVVLSDVAFVFNITGYSIFDWSTNVANWTARITQRALSWDNQIVIVHDIFVLDIYEAGYWSSIVITAEIIKAYRWFDKYIFYNPVDDLLVYDSKTRFISTIPNTKSVNWDSIVSIDPNTLVLFVNGNAQIYKAETQQMSEAVLVNFIGDFAIGTDVISLGSRVLWFNFTQIVNLPFSSASVVSIGGSAIVQLKTSLRYQKINVYNYVTKTWLPSIEVPFNSVRMNFSPVMVIDDVLMALLGQYTYRYNTTSGELLQVNDGQKPSYSTVNTVPVVDGVGYLPALLVSIIYRVNSTSIERVPQPGEDSTWQFVTKDNVMHISTTRSQFLKIYTYDINTGTMDTFSLPKPQDKLSIAIVDSTLVALGSDGLAYAVNLNDKSIWYTVQFQYGFVSTISRGLHDRTVMVAGGKHYQLGHYTDEILFLNASVILESDVIVDLTPHASNNDTTLNIGQALTDGELAAAIVVPVVVVIGGVIALVIVLVKRRHSNKKKGSSNTVGLEARFGAWFTPFNQITFGEQLGQGASGQVFKGTWKNTTVALKVSMTQANTSVIAELELMMQLRPHPNVVQLLGFSVHPETDSIILIIEFCEGGSLDAKLYDKHDEISLQTQVQWLTGIAKGLSHLHSNNIVHRDVAARNVLLHINEPKLTDFGMSRLVDEQKQHGTTKSELGPIRWMSPESLKNKEYSTKSDIWSFGILMYEVTARQEPHSEADPIEIGRLIRDTGLAPVIPSSCHPQLADVMKQCWQMSPQSRPKIESIIESLESIQATI